MPCVACWHPHLEHDNREVLEEVVEEAGTTVLRALAETTKPKWVECLEECDFGMRREQPNGRQVQRVHIVLPVASP
jgi:hypothetical protein